ncbi:MAG TPA: queuosine precursor transporter [Acidimicrobiales bacterium]|nr:queuosine precursor transporter [Acidimicrobiales bacterium]
MGAVVEGAPERAAPLIGPATRVAVAAVGAYVGAQVIADVTSLKIGDVAGRAVDMGTFVYPITFTLRDVVHKALGKRAARTLIVTAAAVNLFMAFYLQWAARAPSDASYPLGAEFEAVLAPLWRITIASILAEVVSELVDTEVYEWFVRKVTTRHQWARVLVSNAVSVPLDNVIFAVAAFGSLPLLRDHALTLPWDAVWEIFWVNLTVKAIVSGASVPLIYLSPTPHVDVASTSRRRRSSATASRTSGDGSTTRS